MIIYKGKEYKTKELYIESFGDRLISVESLENELAPDGTYDSDEAMGIDAMIFFYVPDEIMELPDEQISSYVERECQ